jgi:hypothetical protein
LRPGAAAVAEQVFAAAIVITYLMVDLVVDILLLRLTLLLDALTPFV